MVAEENLSNTEKYVLNHVLVSPDADRFSLNFSWDTIENVFYRREQIYSMAWDFEDLSDFQSAAAKFGGPVGASLTYEV